MKKSFKYFNLNERGSALYIAMAASGLLLSGMLIAYEMSVNSTKTSRINRVKSTMNSIDVKVRSQANSPFSYPGCDSSSAGGNCTINNDAFTALRTKVPGAVCDVVDPPDVCGVDVKNMQLTDNNRFTADVVYTGQEFNLAPIKIDLRIPREVLQSDDYMCGSAAPIFLGINADLTLNCMGLPANCPAGQFLRAVNPSNLAPVCIPFDQPVNCGDGLITGFTWNAGAARFVATCGARINPFVYYNFAPEVQM